MIRRSLAALAVTLIVGGIVLAGNYNGVVTKLDDKEVTVKVFKDKKDKDGEEKKLKVTKDTKFVTGVTKDNKEGKESSLGDVTKAVETAVEKSKQKGARAKIETEGEGDKEVVTKITLFGGKGK